MAQPQKIENQTLEDYFEDAESNSISEKQSLADESLEKDQKSSSLKQSESKITWKHAESENQEVPIRSLNVNEITDSRQMLHLTPIMKHFKLSESRIENQFDLSINPCQGY